MIGVTARILAAIAFVSCVHAQQNPDFTRDVRPILESRCWACHGGKLQMHGLRLDRRADALKGGGSGVPSIVPGSSAQSLLVKYVAGLDKDIVMPPAGPRLKPAEVDTLRAWIDSGAVWPGESGEPDKPAPQRSKHWAFQPISRPAVPGVKNAWVRNPIDSFILDKLQSRGWTAAPPASPRALLRRVYLDITGLPPTLAEQEAFLKDPAQFARLVDDLLARPAYGERWARHWLDVVRYAESNGYERDSVKPYAWRYRDYVIQSFNRDKPFDRFLVEQLAGDQLPDASADTFIATGYYRLGPWDDEPADPKEDRFDQLDDIVSTTSQAFLGLTLGCARCHNHKFEPLTARDYYSMVAIFNGLERPQRGRKELDLPVGPRQQVAAARAKERIAEGLERKLDAIREPVRKRLSAEGKLPKDISANQLDEFLAPEQRSEAGALRKQIEALRSDAPSLSRGYYLEEPGPPPPAYLLIRGKAATPGPEVSPAVPEVLAPAQPQFPNLQRRLALAQWLASPDNPLTARVIVNRVWQHHFGEGLVRTPSDFGVMGDKPAYPELLDWLTGWFIDHGWSIKQLTRLILSSNAYRMSTTWNPAYGSQDPDDRLLWRMPYKRLEVEAIRDSMLAISGHLSTEMFGPSIYPEIPPAALEGSSDPDKIWKASSERDASRRTIYVFLKRSMIVPMLDVLDLCDTSHSAARRLNTSVATQALTLFNGDFVNTQARYLAERLRREAGVDAREQIDLAWRLALARPSKPAETSAMLDFLKRESLEEMCRVLFNLNEFVYAD